MKEFIATIIAASLLSGCVSMTPRAQAIQVHKPDSSLIARCKQLGPIAAHASGLGKLTMDDVELQAQNNLRDTAAEKYPEADSIVVINADRHINSVDSTGMAYRCY